MQMPARAESVGVAVIGGGQAGLAAGYYLRRHGYQPHTGYVILDANSEPGGAWQHGWESLRLFSPSEYSSLPGWQMPPWTPGFPPAGHVRDYLTRYEQRYQLPVVHGVKVTTVRRDRHRVNGFRVETNAGTWVADAVISATGTWNRPFWPVYPGMRDFRGRQLHTADYRSPAEFAGQRVVVVGGGNSGAQILAEVSTVATTTWVTQRPPRYLSDDVDGRVLFQVATARSAALAEGGADTGGVAALGDIVMVPPVRDARARGALVAHPLFHRLTRRGVAWPDGREQQADTIIWCTGFRPAVNHLAPLRLTRNGRHIATTGTAAVDDPMIHLIGYGDWTGPASATLIGVGRTARDAVNQLTHAAPGPPHRG
jgi:putative flavoprotein involved in K+ transport